MAGANKKRGQAKGTTGDELRGEVERLFGKEHFKDAVKQAKLCYKAEANPANHQLLERAYFLRAKELHQGGMANSAVEVAGHLVAFGVTDPALVVEAARLLLALGMARESEALQGRIADPEAKAALALAAADQAVLHPERIAASGPEVRQGALVVREALEALEAGDEAKALEVLRAIARSSPFADWRLFARGLIAFRRGEAAEARENWERLDPARAAARITRWLLGTGGARGEGDEAADHAGDTSALERVVFGAPILGPLQRVRELVAEGRWPEAIREIGPVRFALRRVRPELAERLTRVLLDSLIQEATQLDYGSARELVGNFTRAAEPLPIDPRWNRLWGLLWEEADGDFEGILRCWRNYQEDLKTIPILAPEERTLARALVWSHLAGVYLADAEARGDFDDDDFDDDPDEPYDRRDAEAEIAYSRARAVECFEESLKLCPTHLPTYEGLLDAYQEWGTPEQAVSVARRLLAAFPDHLDTLLFLAANHQARDEPERMLEYARRARVLRPLDPALVPLEWSALAAVARHHALRGRWDEGRAALAEVERLPGDLDDRFPLIVRKAVLEIKAGEAERGEALIREGIDTLVEPAPLWLALAVESMRYDLPESMQDRFALRLDEALKKKPRSETAGALAGLLEGYILTGVAYRGRDEHNRKVVEYLRRTTRLKFRGEDLERVCSFLDPEVEAPLVEKLVRRGLKDFPTNPLYPFIVGALELRKGPSPFGLGPIRERFVKAMALAQASDDPKHAQLLPRIKQALAMVNELTERLRRLPFGGFSASFSEMFAEEDDETGERGRGPFFGRGSRGAGPSPKKRKE